MERKLFALLFTGFVICEIFVGHVDTANGKRKVSKMAGDIDKLAFAKKVIIITGASSGIGAHAAVHLATKGASVSLVGRDEKRLNEVSEQIKSAGAPTPLVIIADVSKDAQRIIDETVTHFGKLNILINNAGIVKLNNAENIDMADFDLIMSTNVRSIVELTKLAIPHLKKTKGNILNVSSACAERSMSNYYAYSMSKAAVNMLSKSAARDLGPIGVRINVLSPGLIRTPIAETRFGSAEKANRFYEKNENLYPVGRVGEVADTSAAIEYLVGDSAGFVTGTILTVDGGALLIGDLLVK
ncbi:uncharacterized protein LOC116346709 [Contarinia nasturtii]|uniref:uncharacterized protein LOC116346709 n=1 Tax=Contarinia nasturtii TaxID=265458 RepID=UPI0012D413DC|nr:uncharacterized protein LOC116346709 [Contarinia nasturtii]XP_031632764.1 uncharacterized protein LOC116346709 [Contarinia nasturtii]